MKITEYIAPGGVRVIVQDPQSADFQQRLEKAVADFMKKESKHNA